MERDLEEMERMLDTFLSFSRGDALEEAEPVDPVALTRRLVENARRKQDDVAMGAVTGEGRVELKPLAIERALANLIGNAVRYGTHAVVSVAVTDRMVRFTVEDDGPGIPAERREEAIKPLRGSTPRAASQRRRAWGSGCRSSMTSRASTAARSAWAKALCLAGCRRIW